MSTNLPENTKTINIGVIHGTNFDLEDPILNARIDEVLKLVKAGFVDKIICLGGVENEQGEINATTAFKILINKELAETLGDTRKFVEIIMIEGESFIGEVEELQKWINETQSKIDNIYIPIEDIHGRKLRIRDSYRLFGFKRFGKENKRKIIAFPPRHDFDTYEQLTYEALASVLTLIHKFPLIGGIVGKVLRNKLHESRSKSK